MNNDLTPFHRMFFDEAAEHLDAMEHLLLALDVTKPAQEDLDAIFRAAHSIKGGAGTFGFTDLTEVTHILETLLDKIRNHELSLRQEMVDVFLQAGDVLRDQLKAHLGEEEVTPDRVAVVTTLLRSLTDGSPAEAMAASKTEFTLPSQCYTVTYQPAVQDDELAERLRQELEKLGTAKCTKEISESDKASYIYSLSTSEASDEILEIFGYVALAEEFSISVNVINRQPEAGNASGDGVDIEAYGLFEEPNTVAGSPTTAEDDGYGFFDPLPATVPETSQEAYAEASTPLASGKATKKSPERPVASDTSIRVSIEKVDQLINLVGELVITQAMLTQTVAQIDPALHESLMSGMGQLDRNTRDLQESVMSIRMMPMSFIFGRFPRLVRDLAGKLGKDIELRTEGESTELDKGLIEKIADPLTHLVRNSLDHGIELPATRIAAGKDGKGTLILRAAHKGGNVIIEVEDDGGGLSRERILAKAHERGLPVSDTMDDQDVWQLIFAPGFSTADQVTDVSGRGVGMDVVRRNIDALGGRVEIASEAGVGTKVSIQLPLTLAILDGMSVGIGDDVFIIPLTYIAESLQPGADDIRTVSGGSGQGQLVHVRGEYLPLVPVYRLFNLVARNEDPTRGILVIVETGFGRMAFFVDDLLGQHQVVIKSLDANYRKVPGIAGATIMGDGKVALIIDVAGVARLAQA